jgi:CarD family transcriptional regulator
MPSQGRGNALKTKNTGPKSQALKVKSSAAKAAKTSQAGKVQKKPARKSVSAVSSPSQKNLKERTTPVEKVSLAERISKSSLVKSAEVVKLKTQRSKLKLVSKSGSKVPVSKITRSEGISSSSNVINARFGTDSMTAEKAVAVKPVLAVRQPVEKLAEAVKPVEIVNFKLGDKIVYPGHGVGEIEGVRTHVLGGQEHHIYNIKILDSGMKVMVPVNQASAVGLRRIIDKKAIDTVYDILRDRNFKIDTQTWNRRFREYSQKIKTGSVFEIAIVLRDLSVLSADKELSFGEKKMLDMAEALLVSEIAIAKARPHDKVAVELKALFV